eukprot:1076275-Pelagomonas_calceolata.AAC.1
MLTITFLSFISHQGPRGVEQNSDFYEMVASCCLEISVLLPASISRFPFWRCHRRRSSPPIPLISLCDQRLHAYEMGGGSGHGMLRRGSGCITLNLTAVMKRVCCNKGVLQ